MMLFALALIPAIILLIYIYNRDKKEKEPTKLLVKCFCMGMVSIIPALILEIILELVLFDSGIMTQGSIAGAFVMGFVVAGLSEELFKYFMLHKLTWNNENFDYMFDGIVYAVFVSLGFATLENVFYVFSGGLVTALFRMVTAIPGHTCFGVYMGYYYSKTKLAEVEGNEAEYKKNKRKSLLLPMVLHGLYDALIMLDGNEVGEAVQVIAVLIWFVLVIIAFIRTFKFVNRTSKDDFHFAVIDEEVTAVYSAKMLGRWQCDCGESNESNFCPVCGKARPVEESWVCSECGATSYWNFCGQCGHPKEFAALEE